MISHVVENLSVIQNTLIPWYNDHLDTYNEYVNLISESYPLLYEEIESMAEGAEQPFHIIMLLNLENEIFGWLGEGASDHCTDIHVLDLENSEMRGLIGHNEDGNHLYKNCSYFVDFHLKNDRFPDKNEEFMSYCYAGILPGLAFSWNHHGMTFSMNAVTPTVIQMGFPKFIVNRDVLRSKDFDDALLRTNITRSRGHSINIGSVKEKRHMLIELAPHDYGVLEIKEHYYHANNYRVLDIPMVNSTSSVHRIAALNKFEIPKSKMDIRKMLGDTSDTQWPVYREQGKTICTGIYDLNEGTVEIWNDNPKDSDSVQSFKIIKEEVPSNYWIWIIVIVCTVVIVFLLGMLIFCFVIVWLLVKFSKKKSREGELVPLVGDIEKTSEEN